MSILFPFTLLYVLAHILQVNLKKKKPNFKL